MDAKQSRLSGPEGLPELRDLIDDKVLEIVECARSGGWGREEALLAIDDCLAIRWPKASDDNGSG